MKHFYQPKSRFAASLKISPGVVALFCIGCFAIGLNAENAKLIRVSRTYQNTEDAPDISEQNYVQTMEYSSDGSEMTSTLIGGDTNKRTSTSIYKKENYNSILKLWEKTYAKTVYDDGKVAYHFQLWDIAPDNKVTKSTSFISDVYTESPDDGKQGRCYEYTYTYGKDGIPMVASMTDWSATLNDDKKSCQIDNLNTRTIYVWCEGAQAYFDDYEYSTFHRKVYSDRVESTSWTDETRSTVYSKTITYYAEGKKLAEVRYSSNWGYWSGNRFSETKIDEAAGTQTDITYSFDRQTGEIVIEEKVERSIRYDEPGYDSFIKTYKRDYSTGELVLSEPNTWVLKWNAGSRIMSHYKADGTTLDHQVKYDKDLKREGRIYWVTSSLYYAYNNNYYDEVAELTYYTSAGAYVRKIRLDKKPYYFYPQAREFLRGEWTYPSQAFIVNGSHSGSPHTAGSGVNVEYTWNATEDCPYAETHFIYRGSNYTDRKNTAIMTWGNSSGLQCRYFSYGLYDNLVEEETLKFKWINDHLYSATTTSAKNSNKDYTEYDPKRRLILYYRYDEPSKTFLYSSWHSNLSSAGWTNEDGVKISYGGFNYDNLTDVFTGTRTETVEDTDAQQKFTRVYTFNNDLLEYLLTSETTEQEVPEPNWRVYSLPAGISLATNGIPSYSDPDEFKAQTPVIFSSKVQPSDTHREVKKYDPVTGELTETTKDYYTHQNTPKVSERCHVVETNGEVNTTILARYDLNKRGYPYRYLRIGFPEMTKGDRYYYNKNGYLLRGELDGTYQEVYTFSYLGESDEIVDDEENNNNDDDNDDKEGLSTLTENAPAGVIVAGNMILSDDMSEFSVYTINGVLVTSSVGGEATVNAPGLYIVSSPTIRSKVVIRY